MRPPSRPGPRCASTAASWRSPWHCSAATPRRPGLVRSSTRSRRGPDPRPPPQVRGESARRDGTFVSCSTLAAIPGSCPPQCSATLGPSRPRGCPRGRKITLSRPEASLRVELLERTRNVRCPARVVGYRGSGTRMQEPRWPTIAWRPLRSQPSREGRWPLRMGERGGERGTPGAPRCAARSAFRIRPVSRSTRMSRPRSTTVAAENLPAGGTVVFRSEGAHGGQTALQICLPHGDALGTGGLGDSASAERADSASMGGARPDDHRRVHSADL